MGSLATLVQTRQMIANHGLLVMVSAWQLLRHVRLRSYVAKSSRARLRSIHSRSATLITST
eukprot:5525566-Amphidinium_carterae.2